MDLHYYSKDPAVVVLEKDFVVFLHDSCVSRVAPGDPSCPACLSRSRKSRLQQQIDCSHQSYYKITRGLQRLLKYIL